MYTYIIQPDSTTSFERFNRILSYDNILNLESIVPVPNSLNTFNIPRSHALLFIKAYWLSLDMKTRAHQKEILLKQLKKHNCTYINLIDDIDIHASATVNTNTLTPYTYMQSVNTPNFANKSITQIGEVYEKNLYRYGVLSKSEWCLKKWGCLSPSFKMTLSNKNNIQTTGDLIHASIFQMIANLSYATFTVTRIHNKRTKINTFRP